MKHLYLTLLSLFACPNLHGQQVELSWVTSGAGNQHLNYNGQSDIGYSVVTNNDGVYLTGLVTGTKAKIQNTVINSDNFSFIAKYDLEGNLLWLDELTDWWGRVDIAFTSNNDIVIAGNTIGDSFIRKYAPEGTLLWEKELLSNASPTRARALAIDSKDAVYITGQYGSFNDFLTVEDTTIQGLTNNTHAYVIKYDVEGSFQWINSTNGGSFCNYVDIKVDGNDNPIAIGSFETYHDSVYIDSSYYQSRPDTSNPSWTFPAQDAIIAKYNTTGNLLWAKTIGGAKDDWGNKLSINHLNEIHIIGTFTDQAAIDGFNLQSHGSYDIFLCKLATDGEVVWTQSAGGPHGYYSFAGVEAGRSVTTDSEGNVFISGTFLGNATFGSNNNTITLTDPNSSTSTRQTGFIAKYTTDGDISWAQGTMGSRSRVEDLFCHQSILYTTGRFFPEVELLDTPIPISYNATDNFFLAAINLDPTLTSLHENKLGINANIYPNPTTDMVKIDISDPEKIISACIYDMQGNPIQEFEPQATLDLSGLSEGTYLLKIVVDGGFVTKKIVKTN